MTVVALFEDLGLTFSDCLLSKGRRDGGVIVLPSVGATADLARHAGIQPSRATRKTHAFEHGLQRGVMLFAGDFPDFDAFVRDFDQTRDGLDDCRDALATCLRTAREGRRDAFAMLGSLDGATIHGGRHAPTRSSHPYFGTVYAAGSGRRLLEAELRARSAAWKAGLPDDDATKRLRVGGSLPSIMLHHDTLDSRRTWKAGIGGFYESSACVGGAWRPVRDRIHLFVSIDRLGIDRTVELRRLMYHTYRDGWLLTASLAGPTLADGVARGFWTARVGRPLQIPIGDLLTVAIPPLGVAGSAPAVDWGEVLDAASDASSTAVTLYRTESGREVPKRFTTAGALGIVSLERRGDTFALTVDGRVIRDFAARFPPHRHDAMVLIPDDENDPEPW